MENYEYFCRINRALRTPITFLDMDNRTLTDTLAAHLGQSADNIKRLNEALGAIIGEASAELDSVTVTGFGTFEGRKRMEKVALHPATGNRLLVPPRIVTVFKPSALLKKSLESRNKPEIASDNEQ